MDESTETGNTSHASRQDVVTEVLNPKTALFFLSFLLQFVNPALGRVVMQFPLLGIMSVSLNTAADLLVVSFAAPYWHSAAIKRAFSPHSGRLTGFASYSYMVGNVWFPVIRGLFLVSKQRPQLPSVRFESCR